MLEINKIYNIDCLEGMKYIDDKSIDMILCDLPYGTTYAKWDSVIPFKDLWELYERIIKDNGAICLFGQEPFSSKLRLSNEKLYRYDWIWEKSNPSNIGNVNRQPLKYHEFIHVFYKKQCLYNKQMIPRESPRIKQAHKNNYTFHNSTAETMKLEYIEVDSKKYDADFKNPSSIIKIPSLRPNSKEFVKHPTQKPVKLCEYFIKTYTNENELILDNCFGSGSTFIACINTNRNFIGFELNQKYYNIAKNRINQHIIDNNLQDKYKLIA